MERKTIKKVEKVLEYELPVKIQPQNGGYFAFCPKWKDCYAQGDTVEEALSEINLVAQTLIEIYQEEEMKIPLCMEESPLKVEEIINIPVFVTA